MKTIVLGLLALPCILCCAAACVLGVGYLLLSALF